MSTSDSRSWAAIGCLLGNAPPAIGQHHGGAGADPHAVAYLTEELPNDTARSWTMAAVRYTATPARRAAITALMPTTTWHQASRTVSLPFLRANAEAHRTTLVQHPPLDGWVFNAAVPEWAYMNDTDIDAMTDLLAGAR